MSFSADSFSIYIGLCLLVLLYTVIGMLMERKAIQRRQSELAQLKGSPFQTLLPSKYAAPKLLTRHNWANIERCIPNLMQVVVLADTVEQPLDGLERAVLENFKRGVNYCFIVSSSKAREELDRFYCMFEQLAKTAIDASKAPFNQKELVSILSLPYEWDNVPHVFYRTRDKEDASGCIKTVAFRGDTANKGIAQEYVSLDSENAEALFKLLTGKPPGGIENVITTTNDEFLDASTFLRTMESTLSLS